MNLSLARYCRNANGWDLVTLTDGEIAEAHETIRQKNNELFQQCLEDALKMLQKHGPWPSLSLALPIAQQLFERKAIHISLVFDALLKRKIHEIKNGGGHE